MKRLLLHCLEPDQTYALGEALGRLAFPGMVLALEGELGAGKTCLVQGLARGLEIPDEVPITSPTFTLVNPYEGRLPLLHLDLYRLVAEEELEVLGFRELSSHEGVMAVEWADRFPDALPPSHLQVKLFVVGDEARDIVLIAKGEGEKEHALIASLSAWQTAGEGA